MHMTLGNEGTNQLDPMEPEEATQPEEQDDAVPDTHEDADSDSETEEDDTEEIDWEDGRKYRIPRALKNGILRHADYTRKTTEVARERDAIRQERSALEQDTAARREHIRDIAQLQAVDDWLAQADQINWVQWAQEDPTAAQAARLQRDMVKEQRATLAGKIEASVRESTAKAQQATARRLMETLDYAQKNITGWTEEMDAHLTRFAVEEMGFEPDELRALINPKTYRALYRLWTLDQAARKQKPPAQQAQASTAPQPLTQVARGKNQATSRPSDRDSMDTWAKKWMERERRRA